MISIAHFASIGAVAWKKFENHCSKPTTWRNGNIVLTYCSYRSTPVCRQRFFVPAVSIFARGRIRRESGDADLLTVDGARRPCLLVSGQTLIKLKKIRSNYRNGQKPTNLTVVFVRSRIASTHVTQQKHWRSVLDVPVNFALSFGRPIVRVGMFTFFFFLF